MIAGRPLSAIDRHVLALFAIVTVLFLSAMGLFGWAVYWFVHAIIRGLS